MHGSLISNVQSLSQDYAIVLLVFGSTTLPPLQSNRFTTPIDSNRCHQRTLQLYVKLSGH